MKIVSVNLVADAEVRRTTNCSADGAPITLEENNFPLPLLEPFCLNGSSRATKLKEVLVGTGLDSANEHAFIGIP